MPSDDHDGGDGEPRAEAADEVQFVSPWYSRVQIDRRRRGAGGPARPRPPPCP